MAEEFPWKYGEGELLKKLEAYLKSTYSQHYTKEDEEIQCFDAWMAMGDSWPTFRNTAVKYLWRYGKKNGHNPDDVMKALHYVFLMAHASQKEIPTRYMGGWIQSNTIVSSANVEPYYND